MSLAPAPHPPFRYADLAALFGLSVVKVKRRMVEWEARGFPAPLPWSRRDKLWNAAAVLAWKDRQERQAGALGPTELRVVSSR